MFTFVCLQVRGLHTYLCLHSHCVEQAVCMYLQHPWCRDPEGIHRAWFQGHASHRLTGTDCAIGTLASATGASCSPATAQGSPSLGPTLSISGGGALTPTIMQKEGKRYVLRMTDQTLALCHHVQHTQRPVASRGAGLGIRAPPPLTRSHLLRLRRPCVLCVIQIFLSWLQPVSSWPSFSGSCCSCPAPTSAGTPFSL